MKEESMLTTLDNPYNPFTQYDDWHAFDAQKGYHTPEYLARIVVTSDALSPEYQDEAIEEAIAEIVQYNLTGNYVRVTRDSFDSIMKANVNANSS